MIEFITIIAISIVVGCYLAKRDLDACRAERKKECTHPVTLKYHSSKTQQCADCYEVFPLDKDSPKIKHQRG